MNGDTRKPRYGILLGSILLVWVIYFGVRVIQFSGCDTATGQVTNIYWAHFKLHSRHGTSKGEYLCPEVKFRYHVVVDDTGTIFTVQPQAFSFHDYQPGEEVKVFFPKGHPEQAALYSLSEYWLMPAYAIMLSVASVFIFIVFFIITFKPWKYT